MTAARRYAQALFALTQEAKSQQAVAAAVSALAESVSDKAVAGALANPRLTVTQRNQLAVSMSKATKAPQVLANALGLLAANNRLALLPEVLKVYLELNDASSGIAHVQLASAAPLSETQRTKLVALIKKQTNATDIRLEETIDTSLQGGFRAFFNGQVWDASLSGQLARLSNRLRNAIAQRQN